MSKGLRIATVFGLLLFLGSFFMPALKDGSLPGYEAAWRIYNSNADSAWRIFVLVWVWPANLLLLAAFIRLWMNKVPWTIYLTAWGLAGQLYWMFDRDIRIAELGVGYWVWFFSGIFLFALTIFAASSKSAEGGRDCPTGS